MPLRRFILLMLYTCYLLGLRAQWSVFDGDSLERTLQLMQDDTNKLIRCDQLNWSRMLSTEGVHTLDQADSIALRLSKSAQPRIAEYGEYHLGRNAYMRGYRAKFTRNMPLAVEHFKRALRGSPYTPVPHADALDGLGVVHRAIHLPDLALHYFIAERDTLLSMKSPPLESLLRARIHVAAALRDLGRYAEASAELQACDTNVINSSRALWHVERAMLCAATGDTLRAFPILAYADAILGGSSEQWDRIPVLEPTARLSIQAGRLPEAVVTARHCLAIAASSRDRAAWCGCSAIMGEAHLRAGDIAIAERVLETTLDTARKYGYIGISRESGDDGDMVHAAAILVELLKRQGRTAEALTMLEQWAAWKDTLYRIEGRDEVLRSELQQAYLNDSIADAARVYTATFEYRNALESVRSKRDRLFAIGAIAFILVLIAVYLLVNSRRRERELAHHQLLQNEQQHVIDELRMREQISEDLHEELGAGLSALKLYSDMDLAEEADPRRKQLLQSRSAMADELVASLRQIIWTMNSPNTNVEQLVNYLVDHAHLYCAQHGLRLATHVKGDWPIHLLRPEQRRNPFLDLKETLANTVKHAHADRVELRITWENALIITVLDNGKGLNAHPDRLTGNGLRTLKRRIAAIGGTVDINGTEGMRVQLRIPMAAELQ